MSGRIPRSFIDDLLVRADIVDIIDSHVPLKKSGSNFVARCPFHSEKTPSFSVSRSKQFYYCFGCGASGNAIGFLMEYNHLDFVEAVEDLARSIGVDVPREEAGIQHRSKDKNDLSAVYSILNQAACFYSDSLRKGQKGKKAVDYLKSRGVSGQVARDFMLGYSPAEWGTLAGMHDHKLLLNAGLLVNKDGGQHYDRFRGRLMFPIRDKRGRVVGFGGRVLDDSMPKYLNSPETPVFEKGREVYGLYEMLEKKTKPEKILVVEGYMDVISLAQFGIHNAVATLGTATSKAHIDLLFRFVSELVLCFDGDSAGRKAAWRAVEAALPSLRDGRQVRIMLLPQGADPDSLLREEGVERFREMMDASTALSDYFFAQLSKDIHLGDLEGQVQLASKAKPLLTKLPEGDFRKRMFTRLDELANMSSNSEQSFPQRSTLKKIRNAGFSGGRPNKTTPAQTAIAFLLQHPNLVSVVEEKNFDWAAMNLPGVELFMEIVQRIHRNPDVNLPALVEGFRDMPEHRHIEKLAQREILVPDVEAEFSGALDRLIEQAIDFKVEKLIVKQKSSGLSPQEQKQLIEAQKDLAQLKAERTKKL